MINSKLFNFQFFLGGREKVSNLKDGARKFGGATRYENVIYSNVETDDFIQINNEKNNISIFIPSTINVNQQIDNTNYVMSTLEDLRTRYDLSDMKFYNTEGSWFDKDNNDVVIERITIVRVEIKAISIEDISFFIELANKIKYNMKQQAVSININDSLALV